MGGCPLYKVWINSYKTETQVLHAPYITASIFQTHVLVACIQNYLAKEKMEMEQAIISEGSH
jgi:hypothetical protein